MNQLNAEEGVRAAKGNVLIGGLGLGWLVRTILLKPNVQYVIIVEQDERILEFFGKPLTTEFRQRVVLIHGDSFNVVDAAGDQFDRILINELNADGVQCDSRWRKLVSKFKGTKTKLRRWSDERPTRNAR